MFQDERIKRVRKTTKWAITFNDRLRLILNDCEEHSKRARKGGTNSTFMQGRDRNEHIKLSEVTAVSNLLYDLHDLHCRNSKFKLK